jgi:hypothetical protein
MLDALNPVVRTELLKGRSRANCYFCFYQRRYEWIWLLDTYPELYAQAEALEVEIGGVNERRETAYTWRRNESLAELRQHANAVRTKRAKIVAKMVVEAHQGRLFSDEGEDTGDIPNALRSVSCGFFCGK